MKGGGVKTEGGLCLYSRISWGKLLVCWFNPTPCVEPEVDLASLFLYEQVLTNERMVG